MIRFTHDGRYVESNRIEDDGLATASGGLDGRHFHELLFRAAGPAALAATADALDTGELQAFDVSLDLAGGTRQFEARIAPSGADEVTAIIRDFTTQRAAEAEVRRSRARIVEAGGCRAAPGLERDLHDGAQQQPRLALAGPAPAAIQAGREPRRGSGGPPAAADDAAAQVKLAIGELRELARGIYPAILTEAGLGPAITALAERSAVPALGRALPDRRLPMVVEATAYFVVSESLANVAKNRVGDLGERRRGLRIRPSCGLRSPTTASAARTTAAARASAACRTRCVAALGGRADGPQPARARARASRPRSRSASRGGAVAGARPYSTVEFVNVIESPRKKIPGYVWKPSPALSPQRRVLDLAPCRVRSLLTKKMAPPPSLAPLSSIRVPSNASVNVLPSL